MDFIKSVSNVDLVLIQSVNMKQMAVILSSFHLKVNYLINCSLLKPGYKNIICLGEAFKENNV